MRDYQSLQSTYAILAKDWSWDLAAQMRMLGLPQDSVLLEVNDQYFDVGVLDEAYPDATEGDFVQIYYDPEYETEVLQILSWLESSLPLAG